MSPLQREISHQRPCLAAEDRDHGPDTGKVETTQQIKMRPCHPITPQPQAELVSCHGLYFNRDLSAALLFTILSRGFHLPRHADSRQFADKMNLGRTPCALSPTDCHFGLTMFHGRALSGFCASTAAPQHPLNSTSSGKGQRPSTLPNIDLYRPSKGCSNSTARIFARLFGGGLTEGQHRLVHSWGEKLSPFSGRRSAPEYRWPRRP